MKGQRSTLTFNDTYKIDVFKVSIFQIPTTHTRTGQIGLWVKLDFPNPRSIWSLYVIIGMLFNVNDYMYPSTIDTAFFSIKFCASSVLTLYSYSFIFSSPSKAPSILFE